MRPLQRTQIRTGPRAGARGGGLLRAEGVDERCGPQAAQRVGAAGEKNNVDEYVAKVKQLQKMGLSAEEITEEPKTLTKYPRFTDFVNYWYFDERGALSKGGYGWRTKWQPRAHL